MRVTFHEELAPSLDGQIVSITAPMEAPLGEDHFEGVISAQNDNRYISLSCEIDGVEVTGNVSVVSSKFSGTRGMVTLDWNLHYKGQETHKKTSLNDKGNLGERCGNIFEAMAQKMYDLAE